MNLDIPLFFLFLPQVTTLSLPSLSPSRTRDFWGPKVLRHSPLRFLAGLRLQILPKRADEAKGIKHPLDVGSFPNPPAHSPSPGWHSSFSLRRKSCPPSSPTFRGGGKGGELDCEKTVFSSFLFTPPHQTGLRLGSCPSLPMQCPLPFLTLPLPPTTKRGLSSPCTLWLFSSRLGILARRVRGGWLRGQQAWAADSYHFKMRCSPSPPPHPPFSCFRKISLLDLFNLCSVGEGKGGGSGWGRREARILHLA